ncbi:MAG: hypothetical protein HY332_10510 [Chloroflexi bacterium]|nr:hypothetical protein [Chloroflexota bacterium]
MDSALRADPARAAAFQVRAFLVATGVFAAPESGQAPAEFAASQEAAAAAGAPLAHTIWTDADSFERDGWSALIQAGRIPVSRPPAIDFMREVAVLIWPVSGRAPEALLQAHGLLLRGAALRCGSTALSCASVRAWMAPYRAHRRVRPPSCRTRWPPCPAASGPFPSRRPSSRPSWSP